MLTEPTCIECDSKYDETFGIAHCTHCDKPFIACHHHGGQEIANNLALLHEETCAHKHEVVARPQHRPATTRPRPDPSA